MTLNAQILAVDNDPQMLGMMGKVISQTGAMPRCVVSGQLAADLVDRDKFEGVFLDWRMPEMNGVDLVRRIRLSKRNTRSPIVMLSRTGSPAALKEGFRAGINLSMEKPFSIQQFRHLLLASRALMFEERRRHYRVPVLETVTCRWDKSRVEGQSVDLSTSGILVSLVNPPPREAEVYVKFSLPDFSYRISLPAKVARVTPEGQVGLRFFGVKREVRERMVKFVDLALRRATRFYY